MNYFIRKKERSIKYLSLSKLFQRTVCDSHRDEGSPSLVFVYSTWGGQRWDPLLRGLGRRPKVRKYLWKISKYLLFMSSKNSGDRGLVYHQAPPSDLRALLFFTWASMGHGCKDHGTRREQSTKWICSKELVLIPKCLVLMDSQPCCSRELWSVALGADISPRPTGLVNGWPTC